MRRTATATQFTSSSPRPVTISSARMEAPQEDRRAHPRLCSAARPTTLLVRHRHGACESSALPEPHAFADQPHEVSPPSSRTTSLCGYAVLAAAGRAQLGFDVKKKHFRVPSLRVVREDGRRVVMISGMKMLATGALYANGIWTASNSARAGPRRKRRSPARFRAMGRD